MKNIALVCNEYPPCPHGGIGTFTQVVARTLVRKGWKVRVAGSYDVRLNFASREDDEGVEVYRLRESEKDRGGIRARYELYKLISGWANRGEVDLIEVPDPQGWAALWPALPVPVITRVHGSSSYFARELGKPRSFQSTLAYWLERRQFHRSDFWCSVSRYSGEKTAQLFGLRNGPDTISFVPVAVPAEIPFESRSANRVVYTGTLTPKKGILSLMKAWPAVRSRCGNAELHIYGKGDPGMLSRLFQNLDQAGKASVTFHGHTTRAELYRQLQSARAAVFPSYAEAFAFAPLEAMATGCPTVYSTRTSGAEAVEHGRDGLLIDPDNIEELSDAISALVLDEELARKLGRFGRQRVADNFSVDAVVANIEQFYRACCIRFRKSPVTRRVAA